MLTWSQAVAGAVSAPDAELPVRARLSRLDTAPVLVVGRGGSGKTRLIATLTSQDLPRRESATPDRGRYRYADKTIALKTIPGQTNEVRASMLDELFGPQTALEGIIFVADGGYTHAWPSAAAAISGNYPNLNIGLLRNHNLDQELESYREIWTRIRLKRAHRANGGPNWLLVAVNKLDLYYGDQEKVAEYYLAEDGEFSGVTQQFLELIGTDSPIATWTLPVAVESWDYRFTAPQMTLEQESLLSSRQCVESLAQLVATVEELRHGS